MTKLFYPVNCYINKQMTKLKERQNKKLDSLITMEKNMQGGLENNPNNLISNLTGKTSSDTEIEILIYGLKHDIATRTFEAKMIVIAENIWNQIEKKDYVTFWLNGKELKLHWKPLLTLI